RRGGPADRAGGEGGDGEGGVAAALVAPMLFLALDPLGWVRPPGFGSFRYGRCLAAPALLFCIGNRTVRSCFTWNVALGENAMKRTSMVVLAVVLGISVAAGAAEVDG